MPASPLVLVSDNGGPFNSPSPPDNYGLDINPGDPVALILQFPAGVANWYLQIGLVQIIGGVPVIIPGTGADEITVLSLPSLAGVNPSTGLVSSPTATVTFTFPPAGSALLFSSTITGTFGIVTTTFVLFARTIEGFRVGPAGLTREGSGAAGWAAIVNPAIRAINTIWGVEVENLANGFLYYNGSTLTWNLLGGDITPGVTSGGTQALEVTGIRNVSVPSLSSGWLHYNGGTFSWDNPPGATTTGTGLWYSASSSLHGNAITLGGDLTQGVLTVDNLAFTVTGLKGTAVPNLAAGFLYYDGAAFSWDTLGGDITPGVTSLGVQTLAVTGIRSTAVPVLASGYLHYNGAAFVWDTPAGGGGAVQTKTVDCTGAGTAHALASITAFDGTYVTVTGLGATGAALPVYPYTDLANAALYGPALSGAAATVTAFDGITNYSTIGGLTGMYPDIVGKSMTFSLFGNGGNNGTFVIVAYVSATSVKVLNASPGVSPDSGGTWDVLVGTLNGENITILVDITTLATVLNVTNHEGLFEIQTNVATLLITGDTVTLTGISGGGGISSANGTFTVTVLDSTHFTLDGGVFVGDYVSGGLVQTGPLTLTFDAATTALTSTAMLAAIEATWPTITATLGTGNFGPGTTLVLTGTTLGPTGSIYVMGGSAQGSLGLYYTGFYYGAAGVNVEGHLPTALTLANFNHTGNVGTFNVHSWIDSSTVTVLNPAGVTPDTGTHAIFSTWAYNNIFSGALYGPALSGAAATITSFTTPLATVDGLTGMTPAIVGQYINFTSGFAHAGNLGNFLVTGYISATSVTISNTGATSPDAGGVWTVPVGTLDGKTIILTVDGVGPTTLMLNGATNAASMTAFFADIEATWPALTASANPTLGSLVLTENSLFGPSSTIVVGGGTAHPYLGLFGSYAGLAGNATFSVSLAGGSPLITEAGVLSLTGASASHFDLCTQSVGAFRCQADNDTSGQFTAVFASNTGVVVGGGYSVAVSSDGTTVVYDTPAPPTPPAYVVTAYTGFLTGSQLDLNPYPNTPFTYTLSGGVAGLGSVVVQSTPFLGFVLNESIQPVTVQDNSGHVAQKIIGAGQGALIVGDGVAVWAIPAITEDNGRVNRYKGYLTHRAATGSSLMNFVNPTLNGGDVLWGTSIQGGPYSQGITAPFMDGSFDSTFSDNPEPNEHAAGSDIGVLGNILYMGGFFAAPVISAISLSTGKVLTNVAIPDATYLPNTLVAFKEASDPTFSIGGPSDCVFIVTDGTVGTWGLGVSSAGFQFYQNQAFTGSWPGSRGVLLLGDDATNSVNGSLYYSSIGIWTDPNTGNIWAADVIRGLIGQTSIYAGGNTPRAICLDKDNESFWVVLEAARTVNHFLVNRLQGQSLASSQISSFLWPSSVINLDDILFDGAYLWGIDRAQSTYYQFTPNGFVVTVFQVAYDTGLSVNMTADSRLYSDGTYVYITGLFKSNQVSTVVRIHPGTGLPVEYFTFPTFSTRGMAFRGQDVFVATAPTINLSVAMGEVNSGSAGVVGAGPVFDDASANWTGANIGNYIYIYDTANPLNQGFFQITGVNSPTEVVISNPLSPGTDANNGFIGWQIYGGNASATCGIQRLASEPPGTDFGTLDSIIQTPAVPGWNAGARIGARVVEYTNYGASPYTFAMSVTPLPGTKILFVDKDGQAGRYPLTITTVAGTINGQPSYSVVSNYGFVELLWDGATWLVIREPSPQGYALLAPFGNPYNMTALESAATTVVIGAGSEVADFTIVSTLAPSAGILRFLRNTTTINVTFQFSSGAGVTLSPKPYSALVTSDGVDAVMLMAGT